LTDCCFCRQPFTTRCFACRSPICEKHGRTIVAGQDDDRLEFFLCLTCFELWAGGED
jgi:hypothetical protein